MLPRNSLASKWERGLPRPAVVGISFAILIVVFLFSWLALQLYRDFAASNQRAEAIQQQMEKEFAQIKTPPNTRSLKYSSTHKNNQGDVGSDYISSASYPELRSSYDTELSRNGWRFAKEETVKLWGKDHGGKQAFYCKSSYTATLEYAGEAEGQLGWTYSFGVSWGLFDECK